MLLAPAPWQEYELLDSGNGAKWERFGDYTLVRPETQAIWQPNLSEREWQRADAQFEKTRGSDDGPGIWKFRRSLPEQWAMHQNNLTFWVRLTPFRHTGVFPEHSAHWPWLAECLAGLHNPRTLVLFGYTGLTSLALAQMGAHVTHVDASKPAIRWAQENQAASGLSDWPIRWLVDDVGKFVAREIRRNNSYDLILLDPPVFGRGPQGEIWRLHERLPELLRQCAQLLGERPRGMLLSAYATNMSSLTLGNLMNEALRDHRGHVAAGELVLPEKDSSRVLPAALFASWTAKD